MSAQVARERLDWCVRQRRQGGAWIEIGFTMIEAWLWNGERRLIEGWPIRFRWCR